MGKRGNDHSDCFLMKGMLLGERSEVSTHGMVKWALIHCFGYLKEIFSPGGGGQRVPQGSSKSWSWIGQLMNLLLKI